MITKDLLTVACLQQPTTVSGALFVASMRDQLLTELENTPVDFCWWGHSIEPTHGKPAINEGSWGHVKIDWSKVKWVEPNPDVGPPKFWEPD